MRHPPIIDKTMNHYPIFDMYKRKFIYEKTGYAPSYQCRLSRGHCPLSRAFIERCCFRFGKTEEELFGESYEPKERQPKKTIPPFLPSGAFPDRGKVVSLRNEVVSLREKRGYLIKEEQEETKALLAEKICLEDRLKETNESIKALKSGNIELEGTLKETYNKAVLLNSEKGMIERETKHAQAKPPSLDESPRSRKCQACKISSSFTGLYRGYILCARCENEWKKSEVKFGKFIPFFRFKQDSNLVMGEVIEEIE